MTVCCALLCRALREKQVLFLLLLLLLRPNQVFNVFMYFCGVEGHF